MNKVYHWLGSPTYQELTGMSMLAQFHTGGKKKGVYYNFHAIDEEMQLKEGKSSPKTWANQGQSWRFKSRSIQCKA